MVQINGEQVEASKVVGKTLLAYATEAGYDPVGIVIEKNMEIIHREDFDKVNIADEDVIEILHFVGGGQTISAGSIASKRTAARIIIKTDNRRKQRWKIRHRTRKKIS